MFVCNLDGFSLTLYQLGIQTKLRCCNCCKKRMWLVGVEEGDRKDSRLIYSQYGRASCNDTSALVLLIYDIVSLDRF